MLLHFAYIMPPHLWLPARLLCIGFTISVITAMAPLRFNKADAVSKLATAMPYASKNHTCEYFSENSFFFLQICPEKRQEPGVARFPLFPTMQAGPTGQKVEVGPLPQTFATLYLHRGEGNVARLLSPSPQIYGQFSAPKTQ